MVQKKPHAGLQPGLHTSAFPRWHSRVFSILLVLGALLSAPAHASPAVSASIAATGVAEAHAVQPVLGADEVLFVEDNVSEWQLLAFGVRPHIEVVRLNSQGNGLREMSAYLQGRSGLSAIHLISHGSMAQLDLGSFSLNAANLSAQEGMLQQIGQSLREGGELLLYGCEVAKGEDGKRFVQELSALTRANVAASDNLTGAKALGGDWLLESTTGKTRAESVLTAETRALYSHVLPTTLTTPTTITFTGAVQGNTTSSYDFDGITFTVNGAGQVDINGGAGPDVASFLATTLSGFTGNGIIGDYNWTGSTANSVTSFTLAGNAQTKFKLTSMDIATGNGGPAQIFTVTGYTGGPGGTQVAQITGFDISVLTTQNYSPGVNAMTATRIGPSDGSGWGLHLDFTGSKWQYIDTIVFSANAAQNDVLLAFDNIVLDNPVAPSPTATTGAATSITTTGATLNGTVNDNGASTTVTFEYGLTNAYGNSAAATTGGTVGAGAGVTAASVAISSLSCNTTYHFRVNGVSSAGTTNGNDATFTTSKCPQTITFNNPGTQSFGTTPTLPATATSGLAPTFTTTTSGVCTITSGGVLTTVTTGTCTINANQAGDATYAVAPQVQQSFTIAAVASGAPTIGTATAGDAQASVTFTAPASNGGSAINTYTATANSGGAFGTCAGPAACTITVMGLTNGTAYTFTVTATNGAGTSTASAASNSVTPKGAQTITFNNPGAQNFGTSPTVTATATSTLAPTFTTATAGVCTITPGGTLTFVTAGSCTINANQAGNGSFNAAPQVQQTFTVNAIAPGAPTIGTATAGSTQATVTFTAPASNGGAPITIYTATANPGGATGTCAGPAACTITVTGLNNGVPYTFTVTATNGTSTSSASAASNAVTPKAVQAITFGNPGTQNFGTTPTLTATATSGLAVTFTSATTGICTISTGGALTFVTSGTCTINADQAGDGSYLAAPQVAQNFTVAAVVPGAPSIGTAVAGVTQATVTFTAPAFTGGSGITSYTVTSNPAGLTNIGAASPITVTGLTNGVSYTFTVTATNTVGTGSASAASNAVTPKAAQIITFTQPPAQNFGTTPTLTATSNSGLTPTFTSSTTGVCTITAGGSLIFVTAGTCTINADEVGNGSYLAAPQVSRSFAVNAVISGAPTIGVATAGNALASVSFTAPAFSGGAPITSFTVTSAPSGITATGASSPIVVLGLTNGTSYTFTVTANNSAGASAASAASSAVTPQLLTVSGSVPGMVGTATATLSGGGSSCTLNPTSGFASLSNPAPAGKTMPYGEYAFQSTSCVGTVTMAITYPEALPAGIQFWKYGPATAAAGGVVAASSWFQFSGASLSGDRKTVTYSITDNGVGDSDGAVGSISDPFAPLVGPVASDAVGIPVDAPWALALLSAMLGLMVWHKQRQRARE
ncbi:putative secreted protein (IPTL-CTERM system target) [Acidovorax sp. 62]|nr:putative secreted protein (IPTL-CTERM system target) [Acidovorax sp. 62]